MVKANSSIGRGAALPVDRYRAAAVVLGALNAGPLGVGLVTVGLVGAHLVVVA